MTNIVTIDAICVDSIKIERKKISFNADTGLILDIENSTREVDYYFNDDCLLFAGMGDIHIHAREDSSLKNTYKEDFTSCACAAMNGGIVHVADMPNNPVPPIDDLSYLEKLKLTAKTQFPFLLYAGVGPNTSPLSFKVPYKVFMGPSIGELFFKNLTELKETLKAYRGQEVSFHCEDPEILEENKDKENHFLKRPVEAEYLATKHALDLIKEFELKGKICHYSSGEGLKLINRAKSEGLSVTCEVTPQHLYFAEEYLEHNEKNYMQMNPPIRKSSDQTALLEAFKRGEIDFLATDHAPHSIEEKQKGISGLTGLDTYASFVTWLIWNVGVNPCLIAKTCSENPGLFFNKFLASIGEKSEIYQGLGLGFGFLEANFQASFTILNMNTPTTITKDFLKTKCRHSPFLGATFPGSLEALFLKGKLVSGKSKYLSV